MSFERRTQPLLPRKQFFVRVMRYGLYSCFILFISLWIGIVGYHFLCELSWLDAFLNASMILTGMGPVNPMPTAVAKVFASCYALFSGIVFLSMATLLITPVAHRLLHSLHIDIDQA